MSLPVRQVLRSPYPFEHGRHRLAVMGVLVTQGKDSRIVDDPAAVELILQWPNPPHPALGAVPDIIDASIPIDDSTFLPRLTAEVPPLASGTFTYFDPAMICGGLRVVGASVVLERVWSVFLYRGDKQLRALEHRAGTGP